MSEPAPLVALDRLDHLWFQVAGTVCNLTCHHCFISCSPKNHWFSFLTLEQIRPHLETAAALGVKEFFYTGGEPFLNREMTDILIATLDYGPATVLTNGTVLKPEWLARLRAADEASRYALEFRVSIDGFSPATNDPIRGEGTFQRALRGIEQLVAHDFLPIITAARTWPESQDLTMLDGFLTLLRDHGYKRPRVKLLPTLHIGAEAERTRAYTPGERVTSEMMEDFDASSLICNTSRVVTDRGVWACPILLERSWARLGSTLDEAIHTPVPLDDGACYTCYLHGSICTNPSSR
jgi:MoaA/NifB/PqqE/SkfB family radical SAM enzyme